MLANTLLTIYQPNINYNLHLVENFAFDFVIVAYFRCVTLEMPMEI